MASSTYKSFLMKKTAETYQKLIDIKDYPDLGGAPEMIEVTTLSDGIQTYVPGIQQADELSFLANYDPDDFQDLKALEGVQTDFAVWFGGTEAAGVVTPDGSEGKFQFGGKLSVYPTGGDVNAPREMQITIARSTAIVPVFA